MEKKFRLRAEDIIVSCVKYLSICNVRTHYVLPSAFWGIGLNHEADILVVSHAGFATEIEVKISLSDLKADLKKGHGHRGRKIKALYFAMPDWLHEKGMEFIPEHAGIISVKSNGWHYPHIERKAKPNLKAIAFTEFEINKVLHLCHMRYWKQYEKYNEFYKKNVIQQILDL